MKPICLSCGQALQIARLQCPDCQTVVEGAFRWPRLARLTREEQQLVELMILSSGSLKDVAKKLGISYPTIRKRLNDLIERLDQEVKEDAKFLQKMLREVERGKRTPGAAARRILENG